MSNEITDAEGLKRGIIIHRPSGDVSQLLKPGTIKGHTQFKTQYNSNDGWVVSEFGIVCFCAKEIRPDWVKFRVITVPKTGMFVHVEPIYGA